jgi:hypothetical protein
VKLIDIEGDDRAVSIARLAEQEEDAVGKTDDEPDRQDDDETETEGGDS